MNRRFCWLLIVMAISILVACMPAAAAGSGQADTSPGQGAGNGPGSSAFSGNSGDSQSGDSNMAGSSAGEGSSSSTPGDSAGQSGETPGSQGPMTGHSGTTGENAPSDTGNGNRDSLSGEITSGVNSGVSSSQSGKSPAQIQGSDSGNQGSGLQNSPESPPGPLYGKSGDPAKNQGGNAGSGSGSSSGTGSGTGAGSADARGQSSGQGRSGEIMISPGYSGSPGPEPWSRDSTLPAPGSGRGASPQRQQQGPPAQSGGYPCAPAQTSPLPPVSGQGQNESKDDAQSRQRSRRSGLTVTVTDIPDGAQDSSQSTVPLFPLSLLLFGGYRRISKNNVLEHDARHDIYQAVTGHPGIEVKTLSDLTGINENTLRYHLAMLVSNRKITCFMRPGFVRYFQNQDVYSPFEQVLYHYLWIDTPRWIIGLLAQNPGQTRQQIADVLGITGPSVTRQMDRLIEDGIVENHLSGRSNHYMLTKDASLAINRLMTGATMTKPHYYPAKPLLAAAN